MYLPNTWKRKSPDKINVQVSLSINESIYGLRLFFEYYDNMFKYHWNSNTYVSDVHSTAGQQIGKIRNEGTMMYCFTLTHKNVMIVKQGLLFQEFKKAIQN